MSSGAALPAWAIALALGAGLLFAVALSSPGGRLGMSDDGAPTVPPAPPEPAAEDAEGLARLLTSEHGRGTSILWAALATVAAAVAARRGTSIAGLLKTGRQSGKVLHGLPWGPQYDAESKIVRWASTRQKPSDRARDFAARYFAGQLSPEEQAAAASVQGATSFVEPAQMQQPLEHVLARWGNPTLAAQIEGFNFYRRA